MASEPMALQRSSSPPAATPKVAAVLGTCFVAATDMAEPLLAVAVVEGRGGRPLGPSDAFKRSLSDPPAPAVPGPTPPSMANAASSCCWAATTAAACRSEGAQGPSTRAPWPAVASGPDGAAGKGGGRPSPSTGRENEATNTEINAHGERRVVKQMKQ